MTSLKIFYENIVAMRAAQKEFFATKKRSALFQAKDLEKQVDRTIAEMGPTWPESLSNVVIIPPDDMVYHHAFQLTDPFNEEKREGSEE
jgi:hypothetical protein